jgi:small RNA 2'-O-methyltransferase
MAFLKLTSTNEDLGYILRKNPASGLVAKNLRQGTLFGYFTHIDQVGHNTKEYSVYFQDADNEVSYKTKEGEEFEYNNISRYNSALFPLDALYNLFDSAIKKPEEKDIAGHFHTLTIAALEVSPKALEIFQDSFKGEYSIFVENIGHQTINIVISTSSKTLREFLNFCSLFFIYNAMKTKSLFFSPEEDQIIKYMNCLNIVDAPYLVRYAFKTNFIRSPKLFEKHKTTLENTKRNVLQLKFGSANEARASWVKENLSLDYPILDVGCGEGSYALRYAPKLGEKTYCAIDIDPEAREVLARKALAREVDNLFIYENLDQYLAIPNQEAKDILLIEVIEHMEKNEALSLIQNLINTPFNRILITTPNKDFSKFYNIEDEESRHDDHKFELNKLEANEFFLDLGFMMGEDNIVKMDALGDEVDGIQPHWTFIIENKQIKTEAA